MNLHTRRTPQLDETGIGTATDLGSGSSGSSASTEAPKRALSRRQVTTAAAWSLPVIAIAVAAPAAAASTPPVVEDYTIVYSVGTRTIGHVGSTPITAPVPTSFTIANNTSTPIPAGTIIRVRISDDNTPNPTPGLQVAAITFGGMPVTTTTGSFPSKYIEFALPSAVVPGTPLMFALSVILGAGTVDNGSTLSWDTSVKILGTYQIGSEKTTDVTWNGTSS